MTPAAKATEVNKYIPAGIIPIIEPETFPKASPAICQLVQVGLSAASLIHWVPNKAPPTGKMIKATTLIIRLRDLSNSDWGLAYSFALACKPEA